MKTSELFITALEYDGDDAMYRAEPLLIALVEAVESGEGVLEAMAALRTHLESEPRYSAGGRKSITGREPTDG